MYPNFFLFLVVLWLSCYVANQSCASIQIQQKPCSNDLLTINKAMCIKWKINSYRKLLFPLISVILTRNTRQPQRGCDQNSRYWAFLGCNKVEYDLAISVLGVWLVVMCVYARCIVQVHTIRGAALCLAFAPLSSDILPNVSTLYLLLLSLASSFDGTYLICRTHYCVTEFLFVFFV